MDIKNFFHKNLILLFVILFLSTSFLVGKKYEKPFFSIPKQESSVNFNDDLFQYFNLGLKRTISSLLWISTILESDIDHYQKKDLNSWMFIRFNSISLLEPMFYETYAFGGPYLSIVKDDLTGATIIYDKGLKLFPNDYKLLKDAGFHYYFEVRNVEKAYSIFTKLNSFPQKSPLTGGTLARIEAGYGSLEKALNILNEYQTKHPIDTFIGEKIYQYRYNLRAEIDLKCLNSNPNKKCQTHDLDGNQYVFSQGKYHAIKPWTPYRPKWKDQTR